MKVSRGVLENKITNIFEINIGNQKQIQAWIACAKADFNIPEKESSDYITLRKNLIEANHYHLYAFSCILDIPVTQYFTDSEIKHLKNLDYYNQKADFPLVFDMTMINDEQYIGKISVKRLMAFKDAQLINYNENAQRTMKHVIKGDTEYYQIALNKEAVKAIMDSYTSDIYIPNTITLNLPEDADFIYDEKKKELIVKKAEALDILDGYHRYIAMSKVCTMDPDFDYDMELRIVQFSEDKAKRFIWQEDQKTKMSKIDSDSLDTSKASNKVVERLNNNPSFLLSGKISRNNGIINAAELSNIIDIVFFKGSKKSDERRLIKSTTQSFIDAVEELDDIDPELNEKKWDKKFTYLIAYLIKYDKIENYKKCYKMLQKDSSIYSAKKLTQSDITRTHKLFGMGRG